MTEEAVSIEAADDHAAHEVQVRGYILVFVTLMALTLITVGVSYLHLPIVPAVTLALLIATIKGSLVACYFMHLISERKLIFIVLGFTVFFFLFVLMGPMVTNLDAVGL